MQHFYEFHFPYAHVYSNSYYYYHLLYAMSANKVLHNLHAFLILNKFYPFFYNNSICNFHFFKTFAYYKTFNYIQCYFFRMV